MILASRRLLPKATDSKDFASRRNDPATISRKRKHFCCLCGWSVLRPPSYGLPELVRRRHTALGAAMTFGLARSFQIGANVEDAVAQ
eukprot:scaffold2010_cov80-Cylindrotheca_fusiformis.AAC.1